MEAQTADATESHVRTYVGHSDGLDKARQTSESVHKSQRVLLADV